MRFLVVSPIVALLLLAAAPSATVSGQEEAVSASPALKLGTAMVDITPPLGTPMAGYYSRRGADGVHDPLLAAAMVLSDGHNKAAIVALDLVKTELAIVEEARRLIAEQTDIAGEAVMITATHSHTGPVLASQAARDEDFGGNDPLAVRYMVDLPKKIAEAVRLADSRLRASEASWAVGRSEGIAFNRRFHLRDGSVGRNPGKMNPRIIRPAGPVDEAVPIILFHEPGGEPQAASVNYSLHLDTVGGTKFSADVPYTVRTLLSAAKGGDFFTLYTTGCCGDVNHIDVSHRLPQQGHGEAARIGTRLAGDVLKALDQTTPISDWTIRFSQRFIELPAYEIDNEAIEHSRAVLARVRDPQQTTPGFSDLVLAYRAADILERERRPFRGEVQVITLGDQVAWVSMPGEVFVELGMTIRQASPFVCTTIVELANGHLGYIPNRVAYPQGNYEVNSARVAAGCGELLVDTATEMLRELFAQAVAAD